MELQQPKPEPSDHIAVNISTPKKTNSIAPTADEDSAIPSSGPSDEQQQAQNVLLLAAAAAQNSNQEEKPPNETTSPKQSMASTPTSRTPSLYNSYPVGIDKADEEAELPPKIRRQLRRALLILELALTVVFLCLLIISLLLDDWSNKHIFGKLPLWKLNALILAFLSGRLASEIIVSVVYRFVEDVSSFYSRIKGEDMSVWSHNFKEKFGYVAVGLKPTVQIFLWIALILTAWCLILFPEKKSHETRKVVRRMARAWTGCLVGAGLWFVKTAVMMTVAYDFNIEKSVKAIKDSIADQQALRSIWDYCGPVSQRDFVMKLKRERRVETVNDDFKVTDEVRTWTPPKVIDAITRIQLPVIMERRRQDNTAERVARITADELFARLAGDYSAKYIPTENVLSALNDSQRQRFPVNDEEGGVGQISRSSFRKWVTKVHIDRLLLLRSINGKDEALRELNIFMSTIVLILALVVWLMIMGYLTTQVMILIATQILAWNFVFNMTARTIFESIIFVFSTRPFDVGNVCSIEGSDEQVVVHRMKFLYTVFRKADGEMLLYPNSSLMGKCIVNFRNVPETNDSVEFTIDGKTSAENVEEFKSRVEQYLSNKSKHWRAGHYSVVVDDVNRREKSVVIYVEHVVNYYNGGDRKKRRKELVEEVKNVISLLDIICHSDPQ